MISDKHIPVHGEYYWVRTKNNEYSYLKCTGWSWTPAHYEGEKERLVGKFENVDYVITADHTDYMTTKEYETMRKNETLGDYMPNNLDNETTRLLDAQAARAYKFDMRAAMSRKTLKEQAKFDETFNRYRANKQRLEALRNGEVKEKFEWDWGKIGLTTLIQSVSGLAAYFFIISGAWPIAALSIPGALLVNYEVLKN